MTAATGTDLSPGAVLAWKQAAAEQFDFWCGTWRAETVAGGPGTPAIGRNEVSWLWGRSALLETFSMPAGKGEFHGRSLSVPVAGRGWCQTWVDSDGQYLSFVGGLVGAEMLLDRITLAPDGGTIQQRMRWWGIAPDSFSWDWLAAEARATDWNLRWRLHYTRV